MITETAPITGKTVGVMFELTYRVAGRNIEGFTHEDSLRQPPAGNCLNWLVGHVVATRQHILAMVGIDPVWTKEETARYDRGGSPVLGDGPDILPFDRIRKDLDRTQELLRSAWKTIDADRLAQPLPADRNPFQVDNLGEMLAALSFHESYHVGQCGIVRRLLGKEGAIR